MAKLIGNRKAKKKNAVGALFLFTAVAVICALLFAYGYTVLTKEKLDARNCPEHGPRSVTAVLIDATDPFKDRQSAEIRLGIQGVVAALGEGDEVDIYTLRPDGPKLRTPDFSACKPRENASFLYENVRAVKEKFEADFKSKLDSALASAIDGKPAKESPILEALADIGVGSFRNVPETTPKRLIIVSDLLQNSASLSHYQATPPSIEQFRRLPASISLTPRLDGVKVCFVYLDRDGDRRFQGSKHVEFWVDLIKLAGADVAACDPMVRAGSYLIRM